MIAAVVCVDNQLGIGGNGNLLVRIPNDMKRFKDITSGGTIIMGRKTYDSLPKKPLENRTNIVITRDVKGKPQVQDNGVIYSNMDYIKAWLSSNEVIKENNGIFIIGGGEIYKELLPFCERVYLTQVYESYDHADTFFPNIYETPEWGLTSKEPILKDNSAEYSFCVFDRIDYEIIRVQDHHDNKDIQDNDVVITVKTFNDYKTVILSPRGNDSYNVYIDDWEYLNSKNILKGFVDQVMIFNSKNNTDEDGCEQL